MTATDVSLMPLAMQLSRTRASTIDVRTVLGSVCSAVSNVMGIGGVVVLLAEPLDGCRLSASDDRAGWIGETQLRAEVGPLQGALRNGRPMLTADLTRIGPPAMAAAAAECGLVSSLVVPFGVDHERVGVLQLLGEAHRPVEPADADLVLPLVEVLAARLADVGDLRRASVVGRMRSTENSAERAPRPSATPVHRPELHGERPADAGGSIRSQATTPPLPGVTSQSHTAQPGDPYAPATHPSADPSTTPRAFAPVPAPRPRPQGHSSWFASRADDVGLQDRSQRNCPTPEPGNGRAV